MNRIGAGALGLAVISAAALSAPRALVAEGLPGSWGEAASEHFVVLGNASEKRLRRTALHFEEIRAHFIDVAPGLGRTAAAPLRVFVARDEATFRRIAPSLFAEKGTRPVSGRFVDRPTMQFVEILELGDRALRDEIVAHEYFHYLSHRVDRTLPVWLDEGLADFWGATEFTSEGREVGRLIDHRLRTLEQSALLSSERLFAADRVSPEYRARDLAPRFYATSWALVHYLSLGEKGAREPELRRYVELLSQKVDPVLAGKQAFGDPARLDRELAGYLRSRLFPLARMKPLPSADAATIRFRKVTDAEAGAWVALAQLHSEGREVARPLIEAAGGAAAAFPAGRLAVAVVAVGEKRYGVALALFESVNAEAPEPMALYGAALTRLYRERSVASVARAEGELRAALAIDADFAAATSRLADTLLREGGDLGEALALLRRARKTRPDDNLLALQEARILIASGETAEGERMLDRIVAGALATRYPVYLNNLCWFGTLFGHAPRFLPLCEKSLEIAPGNASALDSRGVALAATGRLAEAAADLEAALAATGRTWSPAQEALRRRWIAELRQGWNPITGSLLSDLRYSAEDSSGWGY